MCSTVQCFCVDAMFLYYDYVIKSQGMEPGNKVMCVCVLLHMYKPTHPD